MNHRLADRILVVVCFTGLFLPLACLVALLGDVMWDGVARIDWSFLTSYPSRHADKAGLLPGLVGSLFLVLLTGLICVPLGVGAAIYLQEYGQDSRLSRFIAINIGSLAGVPSVIYGLLGLGIFVRTFGLGRSLIAGAATLALLVLPIVVIASIEALRAVPGTLREAALGLGATRWQVIRHVVLPAALPSILTGCILSMSRAVGETAPLIVVGALTFVTFLPDGIDAPFTALPIQIYNWVSRPQAGFENTAAGGIVILLGLLLILNLGAVLLRAKLSKDR